MNEIVRGDRFDSRLDTSRCSAVRNADLTLSVKYHLTFFDPPGRFRGGNLGDPPYVHQVTHNDGQGLQTIRVRDWNESTKERFTRLFREVIEQTFSGVLWLVPSATWGTDIWLTSKPTRTGYRPNVRCHLRLRSVEATEAPHLQVECYRLASGSFRSFTNQDGLQRGRTRMWLDDSDVDEQPTRGGHRQITAAHEFGHYLQLGHSNDAECLALGYPAGNALCYGALNSPEEADLMGKGMTIGPWHAKAWHYRLGEHLDPSMARSVTWTPVTRRPAPACFNEMFVS